MKSVEQKLIRHISLERLMSILPTVNSNVQISFEDYVIRDFTPVDKKYIFVVNIGVIIYFVEVNYNSVDINELLNELKTKYERKELKRN